MVDLRKPTYTLAADINPMERVFCILKKISVEPLPTSKTQLHMIKLGDSTGTINLILKEEEWIKICQENDYVEVLNAEAKVHKKFLQLEMDKWGNIREVPDKELIEKYCKSVNLEVDHSATEYERVDPADPKEEENKDS